MDSDFVNKIENVKENYTKKYFNNVYSNSNIANNYLIILNQKKKNGLIKLNLTYNKKWSDV